LRTILIILGLLIASNAYAIIDGVDYAELVVNGETISFPVGNDERKHDVYYLKKALAGDAIAREIFLGGQEEVWFFIGEGEAKWLKVTRTGEEIVIP